MTGFGRQELDASFGKIITEIQSVNRKYLEIYVSLPKEFGRFENDLRKVVGERVQRGVVSLRIHVIPSRESIQTLLPDLAILTDMKKGWTKLASNLGFEKECVDFPFLVQHIAEMGPLKFAREGDFVPLKKCVEDALDSLDAMKSKEGVLLGKDIAQRLLSMTKAIDAIEGVAPETVSRMREKLQLRLEELFKPGVELDERLLREVAIFAERVDITEEITRFRSHISQFSELLKKKTEGSGRKMDFLSQEMGREINTIGAKSMEARLSHLVVEVKSELEKVREQLQNIE